MTVPLDQAFPATLNTGSLDLKSSLDDLHNAYTITPIKTFELDVNGVHRRISVKCEGESPYGSIKGRTALGLVASRLARLRRGSSIVESTSGNLGTALAMIARELGLHFTAVVDEQLPRRLEEQMMSAGAELRSVAECTSTTDRLTRRLNAVRQIVEDDPRVVWLDQYSNPANPLIHEIWTGPELMAQIPSARFIFVAASTGGTVSGLASAYRAASNDARIVGVDVEGSQVFGTPPGPRILNGIGAGRRSVFADAIEEQDVQIVSSWEAAALCRAWDQRFRWKPGGSTGAVLLAALQCMQQDNSVTDVTCLSADGGLNYEDSIYDDGWAAEHDLARFSRTAVLAPLRIE